MYLPLNTAFAVEGLCLSVLLLIEAGHTFAGGRAHLRPKRNWLNWPLLFAATADMLFAVATPATVIRFGPFFRIAIFANASADVRREIVMFAHIVPGLVPFFVLSVLFLAFFAFAGVVLFQDIPGAQAYFGRFGMAMWHLLVLQTTSNFPDVMMGAFDAERISFFYFLAFIILGTFFLMNLFTAAVYSKYTEVEDEHEKRALRLTEVHLRRAFALLDTDGSGALSRDEMMNTISELRKAHLLPGVVQDSNAGVLLFAALDRDGTNQISEAEFMELVTCLKVRWEEEGRVTYLERQYPRLYHSPAFQAVRKAVLGPWFQHGCDAVLLLMCVLTIWETAESLHRDKRDHTHDKLDAFWKVAEIFFTLFFVLEAALKTTVMGWYTYWQDHTNRLEFVTAVLSTAVTAAMLVPERWSRVSDDRDTNCFQWALMLRLLRLLRFLRFAQLPSMLRFLCVFVSIKHVRVFYETFITMLPSAMRLIKFMFCIVFFYAALGVALYGGLVSTNPDSPYYQRLMELPYGQSAYWAINLNDIPSGLVLMVQLLVVNNWMVFAQAYIAIGGKTAWVYFISFFLIGVVAGLNVLVSFVLDTFVREMAADSLEEDAKSAEQGHMGHRHHSSHALLVDVSTITGTSTGLQGKFRASMKGYETSRHKAEALLRIFQMKEPDSLAGTLLLDASAAVVPSLGVNSLATGSTSGRGNTL